MKKSRRLAILATWQTSFGHGVVNGALAYCRAHGHWEQFVEHDYSRLGLFKLGQIIAKWNADALLAEIWNLDQLHAMEQYQIPIVDVSGTWDSPRIYRVQTDDRAVGRMVAKHLRECGLKHFAYYGLPSILYSQLRQAGFVAELKTTGFDCAVRNHTHRGKIGPLVANRKALGKWLAHLERPLGLMCCNDFHAREAIFACQEAGLRIPEDVALVGVGSDDLTCELVGTPISSVDLAPAKLGYEATAVLDRILSGKKPPRRPLLIPPGELRVRQSSDILTVSNPLVAAAIRFIQQHAHQPLLVDDVLREVPISRRALEMNFKALLGRSPQQQVFHAHLDLAKKLLTTTDLPVSTVAERSGFSSASVMSLIFLRATKLRPGQYRRQFRPSTGADSLGAGI